MNVIDKKNYSSNYCSKDWTLLTNYKFYCPKNWTLKILSTLLNWFVNYLIQIYRVYWILVFGKMTTGSDGSKNSKTTPPIFIHEKF